MKIAVSATGSDLNASVDSRFGRCAYFLIIDTDTMDYEAYPNNSSGFSSGAGTSAAQFVASKGVKYVITGNCGPKAMQVLSAAGIKVILGQSGPVRDVVERFKKGELNEASSETSFGFGMGIGGGKGMGRGCGGGFYGRQWSEVINQPQSSYSSSQEDEIRILKNEIKDLKRGIDLILERLERLEKRQ